MDASVASPRKPPTLYDVAAAAGVSHTTVSRVINGKAGMTEDTRRHVLETIARVGFEPNLAARVLGGLVRPQLGVAVSSHPDSAASAVLVESVRRAARRKGYALTWANVEPGDDRALRAGLDRLSEPGTAGTLLIVDGLQTPRLGPLTPTGPTVALAPGPVDGVPTVGVDPFAAAMTAVGHLVALGHRAIRHVSGVAGSIGTAEQGRAMMAAMRAHGLAASPPVHDAESAEAGFRLGQDAALLDRFTAVIVPNPSCALGLMHGLRTRGVRVPADVSVLSLSDSRGAAHFAPPLTAVDAAPDVLAELAVSRLLDAVHRRVPTGPSSVRAELVVRATTSRPARG